MRTIVVENFYQLLNNKLPVGAKVKFKREKQRYTVRASNVAFAVLTKPFNPQNTVLYTIVDRLNNIRGPEDLIFGWGAETDKECQEMLERITSGESEVSSRRHVDLDIEAIYAEVEDDGRFN